MIGARLAVFRQCLCMIGDRLVVFGQDRFGTGDRFGDRFGGILFVVNRFGGVNYLLVCSVIGVKLLFILVSLLLVCTIANAVVVILG